MRFFATKSRNVGIDWPYVLGLIFRRVAWWRGRRIAVRQIRLALIWWHVGVTFEW